jgi:hypothetical protein
MWRRLKRRTFAPSRPALFPDQIGLALVTAVVIVASIAVVILALRG